MFIIILVIGFDHTSPGFLGHAGSALAVLSLVSAANDNEVLLYHLLPTLNLHGMKRLDLNLLLICN